MSRQKYLERLKDLFKDLECLEANPASASKAIRDELAALRVRLQELEQQILENEYEASAEALQPELQALEQHGAEHELEGSPEALQPGLQEMEQPDLENEPEGSTWESQPETRPLAPIIYEKDRVGYAYAGDKVERLPVTESSDASPDGFVSMPLVEAGKAIGAIRIKQPVEHRLTPDEMDLAGDVVHQVSQQIQNLRLLAATERARAEAEASTRRFVHEGWDSYLDAIHQNERIGYVYDQASVAPFRERLQSNTGVLEPVLVTDEQVGALYLQPDPARPLSEDDRRLVSAVAGQLAQQVENLRLLADAARARSAAEEATRQLTRRSWQTYAGQQTDASLSFQYDSNRVSPFEGTSLPRDVVLTQPLVVRGETVGQLAVAGLASVPPESLQLAASIAAQASIHLETLRLSEQNEKRAYEMEAVAEMSTTTSTVLDPDRLLQTIVDLTKERFGLYHAHIYLASESWQTLLLAAGAGEAGRQMVAQQLAVAFDDSNSLVGQCARERKALILSDVRSDPGFLPNALLPDTRSELAVPMIVGDRVLGVFDVQSDRVSGFGEKDAGIYTTLASQVAVALQNARLYVEQAATLTQLRELDRLKSSFLANMSHELRTPLNSILGFADVVLAELDGPLTENMGTDLQLIQKNGQHLLHLINDVLDMAKIEAGRMNLTPEQFVVKDVLEEVVSITSPLASEKKLDLCVDEDSDPEVSLLADRTRLQQVMINLVNNAIKFTDKGRVSIHAQRKGEGAALITVRDTGMGIPPDKLEIIFQEFAQIDTSSTRKVGGTGLGLPISRRLVEMHGGRLWAESTGVAGEGSTLFVELPLEAQIAEPAERMVK